METSIETYRNVSEIMLNLAFTLILLYRTHKYTTVDVTVVSVTEVRQRL